MIPDFDIEEDLLEIEEQHGVVSSTNWLTSYADVVTLLLCFFILFFNVDQEEDKLSDIIISIQDAFKLPGAKPDGSGDKEGTGDGGKSATTATVTTGSKAEGLGGQEGGFSKEQDKTQSLSVVLSQLMDQQNIKVSDHGQYIIIDFNQGFFFDRGSYQLNEAGLQNIELVSKSLEPFRGKFTLDIQGHTDKTPVLAIKGRKFSSNLELSALRAMAAYLVLSKAGVPAPDMSISGFANHRSIVKEQKGADEAQLGLDRRVSFKMELKK